MDDQLLIFIHYSLAHPFLDGLMIFLTWGGLVSLPMLGVGLMLQREQRRIGLTVLVALGTGLLCVIVFQFLGLRARPEAIRPLIETPNFPSFPSGHATAAFSVAVVLILSYRRWWFVGLALPVAILIALSRVYLGVHYPSDVLGGAVLGTSIGAAAYGLIGQVPRDWRWLLWPQIALAVLITQMAYLGVLPLFILRWPFSDKIMHFLLFGAITFWLNLWLRGRVVNVGNWHVPLAILLPLSFALIEEALQSLSPIRTADLTDLGSDLAGMLFFWWLSQQVDQKGTLQLAPKTEA